MTTTCDGPRVLTGRDVDLHAVLSVLDAAAADLAARGIDQWPPKFDGWRAARLGAEIDRGNTVLVENDGRPVGTVTLTDWADPDFVHFWPDPGSALYVTRMAVVPGTRKAIGFPLGAALLDLARLRAQAEGKDFVRLDCSRTNTALHDYYARMGFTRVGTVDLPHRKSGALYQRPAGAAPR